MKKVLFVCLGNICRSPLAEAIFNHHTRSLEIQADSAGTAAYHVGEQPDPRSIQVAQSNGVPIQHKARQFRAQDFETFDYVIAMDHSNYQSMKAIAPGEVENLYMLREFDPEGNGEMDVPDPYYGGDDGFVLIYEMISRSMDHLVAHIQSSQT
ncbi:hypothetical protein BFP72_14660 [Reichenbachiella sp. 5M10]|uniref:low molecular weight protein-tyrosine-phosphatase n=1 Tax=Reichenbachiella sp. 5M10 TaxID=1889772 RepID=UPI000C15026A|nr:low molecular weight protein-tyrosine-phosphatase [Reichenbachiella sp. 5M10]PIB36553.1 hypothetical protein BFP72_14660 [Reichenbachiella sp. 5M10]